MIKNKKDYIYYLECDRIAKGIPKHKNFKSKITLLLFPDFVWKFQRMLRKVEYYKNCKKGFINLIIRFFITKRFKNLSLKLGFSIPPNVFGPGLSIAHYGTIIVNSNARIGENCRIHTDVNIGTRAGFGSLAPVIGDNCYIGPGVKIYGNIIIGDNIAFAPNSMVNRSIKNSNLLVGGIPAKKIMGINTYELLIPATEIIRKGFKSKVESALNMGNKEMLNEIRIISKTLFNN